MLPRATDSSLGCASAPIDADATAVVADRDSLRPVPRFAESGLRSAVAATTAHPVDPFSASVPVWHGSRLRPRSTTQTATRSADAQTSVRARWLPSPLARSVPGARDNTARLLRAESAAVPRTPRFLCPQMQFAESPDDSHNL